MKKQMILTAVTLIVAIVAIFTFASCMKLKPIDPEENEAPGELTPEAAITVYSIKEAEGGILVNLSCEFNGFEDPDLSEWTLDFILTDKYFEEEYYQTAELKVSPADYLIECPKERSGGELSLLVQIREKKNWKNCAGGAYLEISYGLPQLTTDGVLCVLSEMTVEDKANLVFGHDPIKGGASGGTYSLWRFGGPSVTVNDGPAGIRYSHGIWYPSMMNMTSSWDNELIAVIGSHIGSDTLSNGIDVILGPGMNIQKNVTGGRNFEYCSEDPFLTGMAAASYVRGVQSSGADACIKHFALNNQETYRGSVSANVTERALREIYLRPFRIAVEKSEPEWIMSSYNCLNGTHTSIDRELLTDILRNEFGFKGAVMSDWGSAGSVVDKVKAGNDLNMPGASSDKDAVIKALEEGKLTIEELDACCERILRAVAGSATKREYPMNTGIDYDGHSDFAADAAAETMVLLKNDGGALPLKKGTSVALFGNGSFNTVFGGDGSGVVYARSTVNIFDGIKNSKKLSLYDEYGNPFVYCEPHSAEKPENDVKVTAEYAAETSSNADCAVIVISRSSTEGADNQVCKGGFYLSDNESDMIDTVSKAFHEAGKKVIVLLNVGNPIEVVSWRDKVDALMMIGYPGERTGTAVAAVLSGEKTPSAKLTMTWPVDYEDVPAFAYFPGKSSAATYYEDIYVGYRYYSTFGKEVAYPFGYGLSYTGFSYSGFKLKKTEQGNYYAEVTVKNTGKANGREVVEFYVSKPETSFEQPSFELCAYAKTSEMKPGQYQTVKVLIKASEFATYDTENSRYIADSGKYTFYVGNAAGSFLFSTETERDAVTVVYEAENRCVPKAKFDVLKKAAK